MKELSHAIKTEHKIGNKGNKYHRWITHYLTWCCGVRGLIAVEKKHAGDLIQMLFRFASTGSSQDQGFNEPKKNYKNSP